MQYVSLAAGDPAPWFHQRTAGSARYAFDTAAGRYLVLCFFGTASGQGAAAVEAAFARPDLFNDAHASFFGVSADPADETERRVAERIPGYRFFWDFDGEISRLYGAIPKDAKAGEAVAFRPFWAVIDPTLRILKTAAFRPENDGAREILDYVAALPPPARYAGLEVSAPILFLPNVFEPDLCARLVALYEHNGGTESGFMRDIDGKTVGVHDPAHKRRKDYTIEDEAVRDETRRRVQRRIAPEIRKVHQFAVTRMERYIVACYLAEDRGHFRQHRDNTTKGTAHRRFAVSINLNEDFDGGDIHFPEYGPRGYRPPPGGAVVFSCSLLHSVSPVTRGRRYAFLPFLYDDAAAALRERNASALAAGSDYRAAPEQG